MKRPKDILSQVELHLLLLLTGLVFLSWPLMSVFDREPQGTLLLFLFLVWLFLIVFLFLVGRSIRTGKSTAEKEGAKGIS